MIQDIELNVINDLYECRICLEFAPINKLISPCSCRGTSKYVHIHCLQKWRRLTTNTLAKTTCLECNTPYNLRKKYIYLYMDKIFINNNYPILWIIHRIIDFLLFYYTYNIYISSNSNPYYYHQLQFYLSLIQFITCFVFICLIISFRYFENNTSSYQFLNLLIEEYKVSNVVLLIFSIITVVPSPPLSICLVSCVIDRFLWIKITQYYNSNQHLHTIVIT